MRVGCCTFCWAVLISLGYVCFICSTLLHAHICRHILQSPPFSSFPQHKEKTKVSKSKHRTEGNKFQHEHGRPQVSLRSHVIGLHLAFQCVGPNIRLSCFFICAPFELHGDLVLSFTSAVEHARHHLIHRLCEHRDTPLDSVMYQKYVTKRETFCILTLRPGTLLILSCSSLFLESVDCDQLY